jgi:hypothetical protein
MVMLREAGLLQRWRRWWWFEELILEEGERGEE